MEFHISRQARDRYQFDQALFSISGNVIFANFHAARRFTQKINQKRDLVRFPEESVKAGQINAMGLIDEILHHVISMYQQQVNPQVFRELITWLDDQFTSTSVNHALRVFADDFPPLAVYRREISLDAYLDGMTDGIPNRQLLLEEMLMLWLTTANPAMQPFGELFDDTRLAKETPYKQLISGIRAFFETQPPFGPDHQHLVEMLRSPAVAVPYSLSGQLDFIRERWAGLLGKYLYNLLSSLDLIKEEEKAGFFGPGPIPIPIYLGTGIEAEPERFTPDKDWMPNLVLIAKNAYVWLDQLSKKYQRAINRLDLIPDEELDILAQWGFSGLWLIGVWERSQASAKVKQNMGNQEAVASAYSLMDYAIAEDLGGDLAYNNLRERAWKRGIRLASDMVPNHMGIDSGWVMNHPDWFIALDYSPFPVYSFSGPDLSTDSRVGLFLEDHYYTKSDAAVVFKRVDKWTGSERYLYHGNDGTSMPWNDTAQLDYLKAEVREAVIQTILHVARKFPVIRFDAAMTLAKKHYQRLWFPEPGTGGAIPSRSEHGMTREQFDALMPLEFWREVVDRVAAEAPDTLLLAEAFWLMEGYFVRTLGMHRVYNSAFMNMLRNEDNGKYRLVMKNTLEFDPEILKRFVNFMNNPDERTAAEQFGKGDKYIGICTVMATMPGLPMFGHGQIEGYTEKYGMEFRKAIWDETPDEYLVRRHERDIFPLLHRRYLFSGVENFLIYDFFTSEGTVNEDVFAYSNGAGNERALVVYHNKYASTSGWIRTSAAYSAKSGDGRGLVQKTVFEGLNLHPNNLSYTLFRDHVSGLEYIRSSQQIAEQGFYFELNAYTSHVFLDFREVLDNDWGQYSRLNSYLDGRGVPSISEALHELFLQPIHHPFRELVHPDLISNMVSHRQLESGKPVDPGLLDDIENRYRNLLGGVQQVTGSAGDPDAVARTVRDETRTILELPVLRERLHLPETRENREALEFLRSSVSEDLDFWVTLYGWTLVRNLGRMAGEAAFEDQSRSWMDEWHLGKIIAETAQALGMSEPGAWRAVSAIKILISHQAEPAAPGKIGAYQALQSWLEDDEIQRYLGINRYQGILWFNQESFDELLHWMFLREIILVGSDASLSAAEIAERVNASYSLVQILQQAETSSGYQVAKLIDELQETIPAGSP